MNNKKREQLRKALAALDVASNYVEGVKDEEQESFDNAPENLQYSERYAGLEYNAEQLDEAMEQIESAKGVIEGVI